MDEKERTKRFKLALKIKQFSMLRFSRVIILTQNTQGNCSKMFKEMCIMKNNAWVLNFGNKILPFTLFFMNLLKDLPIRTGKCAAYIANN